MNTDFFRDKKTVIIICVLIILLTVGGVVGGLFLLNNAKEQPVLVETDEQQAARYQKNAKRQALMDQLKDMTLTSEKRKEILDQIRAID